MGPDAAPPLPHWFREQLSVLTPQEPTSIASHTQRQTLAEQSTSSQSPGLPEFRNKTSIQRSARPLVDPFDILTSRGITPLQETLKSSTVSSPISAPTK